MFGLFRKSPTEESENLYCKANTVEKWLLSDNLTPLQLLAKERDIKILVDSCRALGYADYPLDRHYLIISPHSYELVKGSLWDNLEGVQL